MYSDLGAPDESCRTATSRVWSLRRWVHHGTESLGSSQTPRAGRCEKRLQVADRMIRRLYISVAEYVIFKSMSLAVHTTELDLCSFAMQTHADRLLCQHGLCDLYVSQGLHTCGPWTSFGQKYIQFKGSSLWNRLPSSLKIPSSVVLFIKILKIIWVQCNLIVWHVIITTVYRDFMLGIISKKYFLMTLVHKIIFINMLL